MMASGQEQLIVPAIARRCPTAQDLMNVKRSALIVSAFVVGMPRHAAPRTPAFRLFELVARTRRRTRGPRLHRATPAVVGDFASTLGGAKCQPPATSFAAVP